MSTSNTYGDKTTIAMAPTPSTLLDAYWKGKLRVTVDTKTTSSTTMDSGSTIKMGLIPKGAYVLALLVKHGAMSNAVTAQIGDGTTAARFGSLTTMASAGYQTVISADPLTALTADTYITLTTGGANCGAAVELTVTTIFAVN